MTDLTPERTPPSQQVRLQMVAAASAAVALAYITVKLGGWTWLTGAPLLLCLASLAAGMALVATVALRPIVTARREAEERLAQLKLRLSETQAVGRIGWWTYDVQTGRVDWADELYDIFGVPRGEFDHTYKTFLKLILPEDRYANDRLYKESLITRRPYEAVFRIQTPNGIRWIKERCTTEFDANGTPVRSFGTAQDITQEKAAEAAKSEFVANISHELRTPLTSIMGGLKLMQSGVAGELSPELRSLAQIAEKNGRRLGALIDDLLDLEKISSGKMEFTMKPLNLAELVRDAVEANAGFAHEYGVTFKPIGCSAAAMTIGDRPSLRKVLNNLLSNAAKYSNKGDQVEVRLSARGPDYAIHVEDHGPGIPEAALETLFERFTRVDGGAKSSSPGTGLGLNIARSVVEQHGGKITCTSKLGRGTTFTVTLPRQEVEAEPADAGTKRGRRAKAQKAAAEEAALRDDAA